MLFGIDGGRCAVVTRARMDGAQLRLTAVTGGTLILGADNINNDWATVTIGDSGVLR